MQNILKQQPITQNESALDNRLEIKSLKVQVAGQETPRPATAERMRHVNVN